MRSISPPGLVLWLPLGSPAACRKHSYLPLPLCQSEHFIYSLSAGSLYSLFAQCCSCNAWLKDFPERTTLCSHCRLCRLQRSILKPARSFLSPFPVLCQQTSPSNAPATGNGGATGNPHSSFGRFIALYNLCSLLLHCHAPSHSYTGVVITLSAWTCCLQ